MSDFLLLLEISGIEIGLTNNYEWIAKKGASESLISLNTDDNRSDPIFVLPLLEIDFLIFKDKLQFSVDKELSNIDLKKRDVIVSSFPFENIIRIALNSNSEYWIKFGLNWVDKIKNKRHFKEEFSKIIRDKRFSQKIRHKALKYLYHPPR